jgi:hypothetical protein
MVHSENSKTFKHILGPPDYTFWHDDKTNMKSRLDKWIVSLKVKNSMLRVIGITY